MMHVHLTDQDAEVSAAIARATTRLLISGKLSVSSKQRVIGVKPDALAAVLLAALLLPYPFTDPRPIERGWLVKDEGPAVPATVDYSKLEAVVFHEEHEKQWVGGSEMLRRAREDARFTGCNHGQHLAEALLKDLAALTAALQPKEGDVFVLPGTVLMDDVSPCVPCLYFHFGAWVLDWDYLGIGYDRYRRFLRFRA